MLRNLKRLTVAVATIGAISAGLVFGGAGGAAAASIQTAEYVGPWPTALQCETAAGLLNLSGNGYYFCDGALMFRLV